MTFKVNKEQLTKRDALAAELRQKAATLNQDGAIGIEKTGRCYSTVAQA